MSADKDRAIRRAKQKRAKQLKKASRHETRANAPSKTPAAKTGNAAGAQPA